TSRPRSHRSQVAHPWRTHRLCPRLLSVDNGVLPRRAHKSSSGRNHAQRRTAPAPIGRLEVSFQILERSMDRLESMSILLTAVEAGSLSAAARRLATPLSTVSRRISELEAHLKAR